MVVNVTVSGSVSGLAGFRFYRFSVFQVLRFPVLLVFRFRFGLKERRFGFRLRFGPRTFKKGFGPSRHTALLWGHGCRSGACLRSQGKPRWIRQCFGGLFEIHRGAHHPLV